MKITMYELLGLVKDGKAPKRIRFNSEIFIFKNEIKNYLTVRNGEQITLDTYLLIYCINDEVEIIEEDKKIEKIELDDECIVDYYDGSKHYLNTNRKDRDIYIKKINEIIDYLNSKGE